jgi:hypothetical protein
VRIGLPIGSITDDPRVTWHYVSFSTASLPGFPVWEPAVCHIISPRLYWYTLTATVNNEGRYTDISVDDDGETFDKGLTQYEENPPPPETADLRVFDADLTYRNGHVFLTEGVEGTVGGSPTGLGTNPICSSCGVLMFHAATVRSNIREYAQGFRSSFYCETCHRAASVGSNWN